jgi:hypothetical protein
VRKTTTFGAAVIALAASGWIATAAAQAPADAPAPSPDASTPAAPSTDEKPAPKKMMHHHAMASHGKGKLVGTKVGDKEVEDLNAKSLDAAKEGKSFAPPTTPMSEPTAHAGDKGTTMKHKPMKHHMAKAKTPAGAAPSSDASAPPADSSTPAPAPAPEPTPAPAPK